MFISTNLTAVGLKAKLFRGLADTSRLSILQTLQHNPSTVSEIIEQTGLTQSNVSNHLACLRDCGLVSFEQQGRFARYSLSDSRVELLLSLSEELLADVAQGVYECTRYTRTKDSPKSE